MNIDNFLKRGVLVQEESSLQEIQDLIQIIERDIKDSKVSDVSLDWQLGIAYNAALKIATILVRAAGYRVKGHGHHMNTFILIPDFLGIEKKEYSDYLDACRKKRNSVEYDCVGGATREDVQELQEFVAEFKNEVLNKIQNQIKPLP
jgi:uncharacterized protein (UPF0332 family)